MRSRLKDFFIPHKGNDYKPHSLQKAAVLGMAVLVVLSFAIVNLQSIIWISSEWMVSAILPSVIVDLTNDERVDNSIQNLRRNPILDAAAQLKAQHMASNQYFAHYSPDGVSPWHWFNVVEYNFVNAGENLAIHFSDSGEVVSAWMNSPSHRANIMNGDFTEIGVGAAAGVYEGYQTVYVVQLFGTPAAISETPEPTPVASVIEPEPVVLSQAETADPEPVLVQVTDPQIAGSEDIITEVDDTKVNLSTDRDPIIAITEKEVPETEIVEVMAENDLVTLFSNDISTSTGGVPASIDPNTAGTSDTTPSIYSIATQPQTVLQILYSAIALFVIGALILAVFIEIRRQHPVQVAYSGGLMAVMAMLYYIHIAVTSGATIL